MAKVAAGRLKPVLSCGVFLPAVIRNWMSVEVKFVGFYAIFELWCLKPKKLWGKIGAGLHHTTFSSQNFEKLQTNNSYEALF